MKTWRNESRRRKKKQEGWGYMAGVTCRGLCAARALAERGGGLSWLGSPAAITSWNQRSKSSLWICGLSRSGWPFTHNRKTHRKVVGWNETRKWEKEKKWGEGGRRRKRESVIEKLKSLFNEKSEVAIKPLQREWLCNFCFLPKVSVQLAEFPKWAKTNEKKKKNNK